MDTMASGTNPIDLAGSFSTTKERRPFLKLAPLVIPREIPEEVRPGLLELDETRELLASHGLLPSDA